MKLSLVRAKYPESRNWKRAKGSPTHATDRLSFPNFSVCLCFFLSGFLLSFSLSTFPSPTLSPTSFQGVAHYTLEREEGESGKDCTSVRPGMFRDEHPPHFIVSHRRFKGPRKLPRASQAHLTPPASHWHSLCKQSPHFEFPIRAPHGATWLYVTELG